MDGFITTTIPSIRDPTESKLMADTAIENDIQSTRTESTARVGDFIALLKPKVMSLVVFTGFVGMFLAPGFHAMHPVLIFTNLLCLALGAGAAGAINMWYDRDIDAVMTRTKTRPIPSGRVDADEALTFAIIMALFATMTMGLAINWLAAGLLAFSIFFYVVIYTMWLKRKTPQNIVIGGAAGAFPPMIGWAAVTGDISPVAFALFALIFFWTPPHFWALALFIKDEYARAGIPMMPNVYGTTFTKRQMFGYTLILLPLSLVPTLLGATGWIYGAGAAVMSLLFVLSAWRVMHTDNLKAARVMFGYSILYLFALFTLMLLDAQ
jgi:heme o synthase